MFLSIFPFPDLVYYMVVVLHLASALVTEPVDTPVGPFKPSLVVFIENTGGFFIS